MAKPQLVIHFSALRDAPRHRMQMDFADNLGVNFFIIALIRLIKSLKVESYLFSLESNSSELGLVTKL